MFVEPWHAALTRGGKHPEKQKLSSHFDMGWIESYRSDGKSGSEQPKTAFVDAARQRWQKLGEELKADVAEFSARHSGAEFSSSGDDAYHVRYDESGLELDISADFEAQVVRYDYKPTSSNSAGAPEGGLLSMRQSHSGTVEFYSADERLTSEETRQILLAPVLFPPQLAA